MANANQEIRDLREEVKQLAAMVEDGIQEAVGNGHSVIGFDRRELKKIARRAGKNVRSFINEKSHQAAELRDTCESKISDNPFTSVAAAVAGGLLLGALLKRK